MSLPYEGKTALVTGSSGGIGSEIARELARRGAEVALVARREERLRELAARIAADGGKALPLPCDVTDASSLGELAGRLREEWGRLDLLVNNAGKELILPLQILKPQATRELLEVNLVAAMEMTRQCLGLFPSGAAVVNIASAAGIRGSAGLSAYGASKAALIAFTRALARELAPRRVRVNAVAPGVVKTEMSQRMLGKLTAAQAAALEAAHPLGFGTPRDVALAVAFLGSDEAAWITGQTLIVDGGFTA